MVCMGNCTIELILNLMSRMHSGQELFENKPQFQRSHKFAKAIETSKKAQQLIGCWALESFLLWILPYPPSSPIASTGHPSMAS